MSDTPTPPSDGTNRAPDGSYVILDDMAMDDAVSIATRQHQKDGGTVLTAEEIATAREKAQSLIKSGGMDGMQDMRNLTLTLGLPAAKFVLKHLVDFGAAPNPIKASLKESIDGVSELTEHGCQEVRFYNKLKEKEDVAYLLLDECPANHNLTAQLDKLAPHIPPAKRPEIMKHLTALVYIGRSVFAKVVQENRNLVRDILTYLPAADRVDIGKLYVDPTNTTMCIHPRTPMRVGIFVRFFDEVEEENKKKAAAAKKTGSAAQASSSPAAATAAAPPPTTAGGATPPTTAGGATPPATAGGATPTPPTRAQASGPQPLPHEKR